MTEQILNLIADQMNLLIMINEPENHAVTFLSQSAEWLFGIKREMVTGAKDLFEIFHLYERFPQTQMFCRESLRLTVSFEHCFMAAGSKELTWVMVRMAPCGDGKNILLMQDVTMYHKMTEPKKEMHDLRDSVNAVGGMGYIARENLQNPERVRYCLQQIMTLYQRLQFMLNQKKESSLEEQPEIAENEQESRKNYPGRHIMIVEDNDVNREVVHEILRMFEVEVVCAKDGKEAVEIFGQSEPGYFNLIFMDIEMPVMDGNEATKQIRKMYRVDAKVIPIVAMTAHLSRQDIRTAQEAGMDMHVPKPIDIQKLKEVLEKYLK